MLLLDVAVRRRGRIAASATTHPATTRSDAIVAVIVMIGSIPTILIQATVLESSNTIPCASCHAPSTDSAAGTGAALLRSYSRRAPSTDSAAGTGAALLRSYSRRAPSTDSAAGTGAALLRPCRYGCSVAAPILPITPPSGHSCTHRCACQRTVICVVYYRARFVPASFPGLWQSTLSACTRRTGVRPLQFDWSTVWT
jgi:hypothetical protein